LTLNAITIQQLIPEKRAKGPHPLLGYPLNMRHFPEKSHGIGATFS
jgi:hypothetical protein